jgi:hypothetical protein
MFKKMFVATPGGSNSKLERWGMTKSVFQLPWELGRGDFPHNAMNNNEGLTKKTASPGPHPTDLHEKGTMESQNQGSQDTRSRNPSLDCHLNLF